MWRVCLIQLVWDASSFLNRTSCCVVLFAALAALEIRQVLPVSLLVDTAFGICFLNCSICFSSSQCLVCTVHHQVGQDIHVATRYVYVYLFI